jgi:transcriptional regulator with XRE-family HTH domain
MARVDNFDQQRGKRLAKAMDDSGCKRTELAHLLDVSERQVTRWRAGEQIGDRHLDAILSRCEISKDYLLIGDKPGVPPFIIVEMSDKKKQAPDAQASHDDLTINRVKIHRLHINLLRYLRKMQDNDKTAALDRIINNRWAGPMEPFRGGAPLLDDMPLDRYEVAAVLALRAIGDVGREVALINHLLSTKG